MNRNITALGILLLAGVVVAGASGALALVTETHAADTAINTQSSVKENADIKEHADFNEDGTDDGKEVDDGNGVDESAQLQKDVKVAMEDAKKTALLEVPGTIVKAELDNENGKAVYSIEISNGKTTSDVKIDAVTGKVLNIETGNENED
jgi:uncharacterized membrane protein YkoI